MSRIDFRGHELRLSIVDIANPAVAAVPMLDHRLLVVESDFDVDGKYKIVLPLHGHIGAIEHVAILSCRVLGLVPIYGIGMSIEDFVVQHLRAGNGLIEIPAQIFTGDFFDSFDEVFAGRVGEAIAHEISV